MSDLVLVATLEGHSDRVWCCAWSPKGNLLATCGGDKIVRIWGEEGGSWVCKGTLEETHDRTVRCVAWHPNGRMLATSSFDATTCIWEKEEGGEFSVVASLEGHENEVKCCVWDPSGRYLATCSRDKTVWVWEGEEENEYECAGVLTGHEQDVKMLAFNPARTELISCSYDDTIRTWVTDGEDWFNAEILKGHQSTVWSIALNDNGDTMVSGSDDKNLIVWQLRSPIDGSTGPQKWRNACTIQGAHTRTIYSVDCDPSGNMIVSGCGDNAIRIFKRDETVPDVSYPQIVNNPTAHDADINCVRWNRKRPELIASCGDDNVTKIWRIVP